MRRKLKTARVQKGFTQEQMAFMLGFRAKSQYCMIENGQRGVSVEMGLKIADILGVPIRELFFEPVVHGAPTGTDCQ